MTDDDIDRELRFHLDQQSASYIARGMSKAAAERQARIDFGGLPQAKEQCREVGRWRLADELASDLRAAARVALRTPVLTLTTVLALAIGIGANSAIFAVVNGVLLKPLPYAAPDRMVMVWSSVAKDGRRQNPLSPANYRDFARLNRTLEGLEGYFSFLSALKIGLDDRTEVAYAHTVTPGLFELLGRRPALGRGFRADASEIGVVLSHGYWRRRFGGDARILGRALTVDGQPGRIIGVMPADFVFPYPGMLGPSGFTRETSVDMWVPMAFDGPMAVVQRMVDQSGQLLRGVHWLGAIGRARPGVTLEQVQSDLTAIARQLEKTYPATNQGWGATVISAREQTVGAIRPALLVLLAGVGLVLLMSAINVANLVFARSLAREKEQATRVALGAGRRRLVQQSMVESLLLAVGGGTLGLLFMRFGIQLLLWLAPADLPRVSEVTADWRVVGATLALAILTGAIVGLLPAVRAASVDPQSVLQEHGRGTAGGRSHHRYRAGLVVAEVALAVILTVGAGLLLRSFVSLMQVHPGFEPAHLLTWQMNLPERLQNVDDRRAFYRDFFERLERLPGTVSVGGTTRLPLGSTSVSTSVEIQGKPVPVAGLPEVEFRRSLHHYFEAMGIPLIRGRGFPADDGPNLPPIAVVNQAMARRLFPGEEPIGQHVRTGSDGSGPWMEIVGVVGDVRHTGLEQAPVPELYIPYLQNPPIAPFIVIRAEGDPAALVERVRAAAREIDKDLPLFDMRTMAAVRAESVAQRRFIMLLGAVFGLLALLLAGVGIDGVMSVAVGERTQEMGVRLALGARSGQVLQMVLGEAARLALLGVALGLGLTWATVPLIRTQLFGVQATDPLVFAGVSVVLLVIAMMAAAIPAMRAAHVDPVQVLRKA